MLIERVAFFIDILFKMCYCANRSPFTLRTTSLGGHVLLPLLVCLIVISIILAKRNGVSLDLVGHARSFRDSLRRENQGAPTPGPKKNIWPIAEALIGLALLSIIVYTFGSDWIKNLYFGPIGLAVLFILIFLASISAFRKSETGRAKSTWTKILVGALVICLITAWSSNKSFGDLFRGVKNGVQQVGSSNPRAQPNHGDGRGAEAMKFPPKFEGHLLRGVRL